MIGFLLCVTCLELESFARGSSCHPVYRRLCGCDIRPEIVVNSSWVLAARQRLSIEGYDKARKTRIDSRSARGDFP
jgi:hypothetical protein